MKNIDLNEVFAKLKVKIQKQKAGTIKLSAKEKINLLEQLSNLINSGIPITNAFSIISYQTKEIKIKALVADLLEKINKGIPLRESCATYSQIFSSFDIAIIEMGEITGKLGDSIELIKEKEEKNAELKSKIIGALTYPMVVIALSIAMIVTFMLFVIPKIQKMYSDAKVNLPGLTEFVIGASEFLQENIVILGAILAMIIVGLGYLKTNPKTKIYFDKYVLNIPIFGGLIRKKVLSLFARNLSTLLNSGIIINKALEITKKSLENAYYEKEIDSVMQKISSGIPLSEAMGIKLLTTGKESEFFPLELSSLVKIGEQTGKLPGLLGKISIRYNKEIDNIVKNLATAIEPIVIVGVGGIVGTMIMAILLPFFNMVNVVGK
ncbi:MAG: type II secretion system F family protein [Candidatus Gracilibacteria bacterium]|nr:type II secretion system F family protein [Candidatus Gracilibacteria bacterium]